MKLETLRPLSWRAEPNGGMMEWALEEMESVAKWPWINTYRYSLLGDELDQYPFDTYFDVNYRATWF
jgi:hypothetical protein